MLWETVAVPCLSFRPDAVPWALVGNPGHLLSSALCSLLIWFTFRDFRTESWSLMCGGSSPQCSPEFCHPSLCTVGQTDEWMGHLEVLMLVILDLSLSAPTRTISYGPNFINLSGWMIVFFIRYLKLSMLPNLNYLDYLKFHHLSYRQSPLATTRTLGDRYGWSTCLSVADKETKGKRD